MDTQYIHYRFMTDDQFPLKDGQRVKVLEIRGTYAHVELETAISPDNKYTVPMEKLSPEIIEYGYGMRSRPIGIGAQPRGHSRVDEEDGRFRYGVIYYPKPLTPEDVQGYELVPIISEEGPKTEYQASYPQSPMEQRVLELILRINAAKLQLQEIAQHTTSEKNAPIIVNMATNLDSAGKLAEYLSFF